MASRSSWSRFPPITLSAATRDRRHHQADELYAAVEDVSVRRVLPDACAPIPPFVRRSAVRRLRVSHAVVGQVRAPEHVPARDVGLDGLDPSTSPLSGCFGPFSVTVRSQFRVVRMSPEYS
jgi:hypothetical protein